MTDKAVFYQCMKPGDETEVCELIADVFHEFVAPHFTIAGIIEFLRYIQPDFILDRIGKSDFGILAKSEDQTIGVIFVRNHCHISLFFVKKNFQRQHIGKTLIRKAIEKCVSHEPGLIEITVNSSPNSLETYQKLGFEPLGSEQMKNGIRYYPMAIRLEGKTDD